MPQVLKATQHHDASEPMLKSIVRDASSIATRDGDDGAVLVPTAGVSG